MLKMTIDNEEVLSNNDISIKEEILSPSSTILNNVYPKTWEQDKDYTSRFYYPKDYSKLNIQNFSVETEEAGTTIEVNGSATLTDVDTTKESRVLTLKGQTSQTGTPTPSSPIPVNVVSGDNTIDICGKNLASDTTLKQGLWCGSSTISSNNSGWYVVEPCLPNTTYIISKKNTTGTIYINFTSVYPTSGTTTGQDNQGSSGIKNLSFTTPSNANYIFIGLFAGSPSDTQKQECIEELMLEKGSTKTTYEPYIGSSYPIQLGDIELCKIGTYQDYIYKNNGKWYLHKEIGKWYGKDFDWTDIGVQQGVLHRSTGVYNLLINSNGFSNFYNCLTQNTRTNPCFYINDSNRYIDVIDSSIPNGTFKTYCETNNIMFYAPLYDSINTEITDSTLLEQLESLSS